MIYPQTFDRLHIGPSGIPHEAPGDQGTVAVIDYCRAQGWDTLELAFVHQVYLKEEEALKTAEASRQHGFPISAHGSYGHMSVSTSTGKASRPTMLSTRTRATMSQAWHNRNTEVGEINVVQA